MKNNSKIELAKATDVTKTSPERRHIAKIFKMRIDKAIEELGVGYDVTLQERFDKTQYPLK
ncbi:hypothetical protein G4O51_03200 [Candidatus Bathyarchaeota archaeon A05DMB-2]|jgi:hypothetical protein|nr:hypothetical protein [Candidatus Bathyarchaeota archaeon A05DMB-2]